MIELTMPQYKKIEAMTSGQPEFISFSQGTVKVGGTPQPIKDHVRDLMRSDIVDYYQYVGGIYALRYKIAEDMTLKFGQRFTPDHVLITHGAIGGITDICLGLLRAGDQVLLPEPMYPSYLNIVKFSKAEPIFVEGFVEENGQWFFDIERIKKAVTSQTKMVILSNPSNPCGTCLDADTIKALKEFCESRGIYIIFDEVYDNFIYEGGYCSGTPYALESEYILRTGSFSKDFAMSGWRVGFIIAATKTISGLAAVQDGTLCCPSVVGQHAALFALQHKELVDEQVRIVRSNRDIVCQYLQPLVEKGILSFAKPKAGIFFFLKGREADSEHLVMDILHKTKVALVPGRDFGVSAHTKSHMRMCFARPEPLVHEGMKRILDYFL